MFRIAIALVLLSSPALAEDSDAFKDCQAIGQTAKGETVYALGCKALKPENTSAEYNRPLNFY